jgi:ATP-dependent phosphofructokinase / diphosphate-dependent phosphofructokinase
MTKKVGILTAGSDCPGLNAAIRGFGKTAQNTHAMKLIGFRDGFRGLMANRSIDLGGDALSNILTAGGTILGTSRDVPHEVEETGRSLIEPVMRWLFTKKTSLMHWCASAGGRRWLLHSVCKKLG